jgi:hypothetical protein
LLGTLLGLLEPLGLSETLLLGKLEALLWRSLEAWRLFETLLWRLEGMWLLEALLGRSETVLGRSVARLLRRLKAMSLLEAWLRLPIAELLGRLESLLRGLPVALLWLAVAWL